MSVRREVRLRKDFLYKKASQVQEIQRNDKKRKLKAAVSSGKSIPTEIVGEARQLQHELDNDLVPLGMSSSSSSSSGFGGSSNGLTTEAAIDDEYASLGLREPKVCVTTSRDPSSRLKQFAKEIKICIPNSQSINRGNTRVDDLVDACRKSDFTDIVVLNETRCVCVCVCVCDVCVGVCVFVCMCCVVCVLCVFVCMRV